MKINFEKSVAACVALLRQMALTRYHNLYASDTFSSPYKILKQIRIISNPYRNVEKYVYRIHSEIEAWEKNESAIYALSEKINKLRKKESNSKNENQTQSIPFPALKHKVQIFSSWPLIFQLISPNIDYQRAVYLSPHCFSGYFIEQKDTDPQGKNNYHPNIIPDIIRQLPRSLINPIAIYNNSNNDKKQIVSLINIRDALGAMVVVPILLSVPDSDNYSVIMSVYAKNDKPTGLPDFSWFYEKINLKKLVYINKNLSTEMSIISKVQSIYDVWKQNFSRPNSIFTEEDLQMLQAAKPKHYQFKNGEVVGQITQDGARKIISLLNHSDPSTFIHESAHISLMWLEQDVREGIASPQAMKDYEIVRKWVGAEGDNPISERQHQRFAEAFEAWVMKNQCPVPELASPFERCSIWLKHLYNGAMKLELPVSEDVEAVFARLLGKDNQTNLLDADDEKLLDIEVDRICHETELAISIRGLEDSWTLDIDDGNDDEDDNFQRPGT